MSDKILTMKQARIERDMLQENISALVQSFESRVDGMKVVSVSLQRTAKKDRRNLVHTVTTCTVLTQLKEGSGILE